MSKYETTKSGLVKDTETGATGVFRTVGGRRIFIKEGQDLASAMKESGKFPKKEDKEPEGFENSKIRDKNGNLMKVYHGTDVDFEEFDIEKAGSKGNVAYGKGAYFTPDKEVADRFGDKTKEAYLNIQNPYIIQTEEQLLKQMEFKQEALQKKVDVSEIFKANGYDGVISYEDIGSDKIHEIIVFDKKQIHIIKKG